MVDTGTGTGTIGIEALKGVLDTASVDDNPVITTAVAEEGCKAPLNT